MNSRVNDYLKDGLWTSETIVFMCYKIRARGEKCVEIRLLTGTCHIGTNPDSSSDAPRPEHAITSGQEALLTAILKHMTNRKSLQVCVAIMFSMMHVRRVTTFVFLCKILRWRLKIWCCNVSSKFSRGEKRPAIKKKNQWSLPVTAEDSTCLNCDRYLLRLNLSRFYRFSYPLWYSLGFFICCSYSRR